MIWVVITILIIFINFQINELSHVNIPVMLLPDDFRAFSKLKVDNNHFNKWVQVITLPSERLANSLFTSDRENMPSHFKIKEYCPLVFRNLRERFGIDDQDYKESMTR